MFGTRETFEYIECSKCGCLQIKEIPEEMNKFYQNKKYYSFNLSTSNFFKKIIIRKRNEYCLFGNSFSGQLINLKFPNEFFSILGNIGIDLNSRILDVGCGSGALLFNFKESGFTKLMGVDPFLEKEINLENLKILKKSILQVSNNQKFDFIIFSHSFEHLENPIETLNKVKKILSKNGKCIIRIPVKTDYIWNKYGTNWVQIDAPRHFFIYSMDSFKILVEKAGFKIKKTFFDSTEFQFWGSEQYKKDIPIESENSYAISPEKSIFTHSDIKKFKLQSQELNDKRLGDQAIFIMELNNET